MTSMAKLAVLIALVSLTVSAQAQNARPPNIVILFADDLGYADLGSYGNPYIRTPTLDTLAREGQRWTDFYVAAPVCSPSRGALITGQLSVRSGLYGRQIHVMHPNDSHGIPEEAMTLPEALKSAGYRTGMFGKWHLGDAPENFPTRNGFDYWYGVPYSNDMDFVGGMDVDQVMELLASGQRAKLAALWGKILELFENPKSEYWNIPLYRSQLIDGTHQDELVERPINQPTFTRRITEEAERFIRTNRDRPFFVYLPYSMPHLPVFASEAFAGKSLRGPYGDAVEEIDWSVGRIRETLESLGIAENTLVFFSSDNGPWQEASTFGAGSAGVLRGNKGTTWEGGVRVPGIFWWPERIKPGVVSDMGTTIDVFATALHLAEVPIPSDSDGFALTETLLRGAPGPRSEMPYYHKGYLKAYRKGRYKVVFFGGERTETELQKPLLYDLHQDIAERRDISEERPDILEDLLQAVESHREQVTVADPIFDRRLNRLSAPGRRTGS